MNSLISALNHLNGHGLAVFALVLGAIEFSFGLYEKQWTKNERLLDIASFTIPKFVIAPLTAYYGLKLLPYILPAWKGMFAWVPFFWGFLILAVADDLTQYWYHRLHHQVPWL